MRPRVSVASGPSQSSRLGSSSSKTFELALDTVPRATSENEIRLITLVKDYKAGHEDPQALDAIFELLYEETSPNIHDADAGRSALHWAVLQGQTQLVHTLLEAGALVNTLAKDGTTPLMTAIRKGSAEVVELLLEEGARTELINTTTGMGPLLLACMFCNLELVQLLLDRKAAPDITWGGPQGPLTPLVAAAGKVCEPKPTADQYMQIVDALLAAGASPNIVINQDKGETLLHNSVMRCQVALTRALLDAGASTDACSKDGHTPLMVAVRTGSVELVEMLIDAGAQVDFKNELSGKSAFSMACNLGNLQLVQLLLAKGANVNTRWFNPNEFNAPILVGASKCDDSLGLATPFGRLTPSPSAVALALASPSGTQGLAPPAPGGVPASAPAPGPTGVAGAGAGGLQVQVLASPTSPSMPPTLRRRGSESTLGGSGRNSSGTQVYLDIVRELLTAGADPNMQGSKNGITPLIIAVDNNHYGLLRLLLDSKANPNLPMTSGRTPLIAACDEGLADMARLLLEYGADPNRGQRDGWVPLMGAVLNRSLGLAEMLLRAGAQHSVLVPAGEMLCMESTPLMAACGEGALEMARLLLQHGADPNQSNSAGQTAVWCACRGGHPEVLQLLLSKGAKLRPQRWTLSPLVQAAWGGCRRCVEVVLEAGAHLDEHDANMMILRDGIVGGRYTPLAAAASHGCREVVELLLDRGADPNATWTVEDGQIRTEQTPLLAALCHHWDDSEGGDEECAAIVELLLGAGASISSMEPEHGHAALEVAAREGRHGALRVLLSRGARANAVDKDGATPIILAALKGSVECVRLLLEAGANPNATTLVGVSPLVAAIGALAAGDGNLDLIQLLLDAGATPNAPFFEEDTILTAAVDGGNPALVATLLSAGADPNQTNTSGALPLQLAVSKGHTELVRLLLEAGANPHVPNLDWSTLRYHQKGRHDILELLARSGITVPPPPMAEGSLGAGGPRGRSSSSSGQASSASGRRAHSRPSTSGIAGTPSAGAGGGEARMGSSGRRRASQNGRVSGSGLVGAAASRGGSRISGSGNSSAGHESAAASPTGTSILLSAAAAVAAVAGSGGGSGSSAAVSPTAAVSPSQPPLALFRKQLSLQVPGLGGSTGGSSSPGGQEDVGGEQGCGGGGAGGGAAAAAAAAPTASTLMRCPAGDGAGQMTSPRAAAAAAALAAAGLGTGAEDGRGHGGIPMLSRTLGRSNRSGSQHIAAAAAAAVGLAS